MKKFRYSMPRLTLILIIAGLAVCLAGFGLNLYVCITDGTSYAVNPAIPLTLYILTFAVTAAAGGLLVSILVSSYYAVDGKKLKTAFGAIRSSYPTDDIDALLLDRATDRLYVRMKDGGIINVVIKSAAYADFVQAVLDANPAIEYAIQSLENTPDDKNRKN